MNGGEYVWSQPFNAAAARSSLAITRSCSLAMRSRILRPGICQGELCTKIKTERINPYGDFAARDGFAIFVFRADPASESTSRRLTGTLSLDPFA